VIVIKLSTIIGNEQQFSMQHRILNIILLSGWVISLWSALTSYFLRLNYMLAFECLVANIFMMSMYYLSFVKRKYTTPIVLLLILALLLFPSAWFSNGGTMGHIPLTLALFAPMVAILLNGIRRIVAILLLILLANGLIYYEYEHIFTVVGYPSAIDRYIDIALNLTTSIIATTFIFITIQRYYDKEYQRATTYLAQNQKAQEHLHFLSHYDILTELHNRTSFESELTQLESLTDQKLGAFVVDVDGLKFVNDTLGHQQGDLVLQRAAAILKSSFCSTTNIFRIGGDEFVIFLPETSLADMEQFYKVIRDNLLDDNRQNGLALPLQISVGYAVGPTTEVRSLLRDAESKMYREKLFHHSSDNNSIIQTVKQMLLARDNGTGDHSDRLQKLLVAFASAAGIAESAVADLLLFAKFHDVGKMGIADSILLKPGPLTESELKEMHRHCEIGHRIAHASTDMLPIADWILKHHEWWNGQGYPLGLNGKNIPLECRILAIVDAYDAMISDRPYRKAIGPDAAVEELLRCSGTQFDPALVEIFIATLT